MSAGRWHTSFRPSASRAQIFSTAGFGSSLLLSLELAAATLAIVLLLMVPTMVALRHRSRLTGRRGRSGH